MYPACRFRALTGLHDGNAPNLRKELRGLTAYGFVWFGPPRSACRTVAARTPGQRAELCDLFTFLSLDPAPDTAAQWPHTLGPNQ